MTKAWVKTSGTSTTNGASALFFGFHWSFTIMEPSGKGCPFPGVPALYAEIIVGLATITLSTSSVRAEDTMAQSSYPLKSENAIPPGDFSEYLSLAESAVAARIASRARTVTPTIKPATCSAAARICSFCSLSSCSSDFVTSSDMIVPREESRINVCLGRLQLGQKSAEQSNWTMVSTIPWYQVCRGRFLAFAVQSIRNYRQYHRPIARLIGLWLNRPILRMINKRKIE